MNEVKHQIIKAGIFVFQQLNLIHSLSKLLIAAHTNTLTTANMRGLAVIISEHIPRA
jgi:hypothetical protein